MSESDAPAAIETVELGKTGIQVSRLILGCMCFGGIGSARATWGRDGLDDEASLALLDSSHEFGITTLDTATTYTGGQSERVMGKWLEERGLQAQTVVATKVGMYTDPDGHPDLSRDNVMAAIANSLERLRLDSVDMFLAHTPDATTPIAETLEAFNALLEDGRVRAIGVSNVDAKQLTDALDTADRLGLRGWGWVQNAYSLFERDDADSVLRICEERGLGYTPHTPLYGGVLTGKYLDTENAPAGSRVAAKPGDYDDGLDDVGRESVRALAAEAARRGVTTAALAMAWILSDPRVTAPVAGPLRPEHFDSLRQALELRLDADERDALTRMFVRD